MRLVDRLDPRALERQIGILVDIKEVGRAQVIVAVVALGVDAGRLDLDIDPRVGRVLLVELDRAAEALEPAAHLRDHHMPNGKLDVRMCEINLPGHGVLLL